MFPARLRRQNNDRMDEEYEHDIVNFRVNVAERAERMEKEEQDG